LVVISQMVLLSLPPAVLAILLKVTLHICPPPPPLVTLFSPLVTLFPPLAHFNSHFL
jgi:hypothetical protein